VPENFVPTLIKDHRICFDIAKLLWAEDDLFFYIGHSYVRQHPDSFSMYNIPAENMDALEMGLLGRRPHCPDLRDSEEFAPIFYISGFLVCVANIRQLLPDVAAETIYGFLRQPLQFDLKALLDN
jgi:hypothetical protein